jgi:hypothetical protein
MGSEERKPDSSSESSAITEAVKQLAKPIYDDGLKLGVIQAGKAIETAVSAVNAALMPLRVLVVGIDTIEPFLKDGIARRFAAWGTKNCDVQTPPPHVAVPAIEALRYTASVDELREMFLNLVASAMDKNRSDSVCSSFVEIIKQLEPDEARILTLFFSQQALYLWSYETQWHRFPPGDYVIGPTFFRLSLIGKDAGCSVPKNVPRYIDNLLRLGLVYEPAPYPFHVESVEGLRDPRRDSQNPDFFHVGERISELIDLYPELEEVATKFKQNDYSENHFQIWRSEIRLTEFGKAFCWSSISMEDPNGFMALGAGNEPLMGNRIHA